MANRKEGELTDGEVLFIDRYLSNGYDRKEAVISAGFKTDSPSRYGSGVLNRPLVKTRIKQLVDNKRQDFFINEQDVKIALWEEANFRGKGSTQSGRIQALVALGKTMDMFARETAKGGKAGNGGIVVHITNYGKEEAKDITGEVIDGLKGQDIEAPLNKLELN